MTWTGSEGSRGASLGKLRSRAGDIEHALVKIWRDAASIDAAQDKATGESLPRVRSRLANLVIIIPELTEESDRRALDGLLTDLCVSYPSRFFIVQLAPERDGEEQLRSFVSSRCVLAKSGSHVCSEEVYLDVTEKGLHLVPHLLLSLFVPDVATTLLLMGDFLEWGSAGKGVVSFKGVCERLMYDSRLFGRYHESLEILLEQLNLRPAAVRALTGQNSDRAETVFTGTRHLRDIAWSTLKRWGLLIVEQFDSEAFVEVSPIISRVEFLVGSRNVGHIPPDALLLAGWLIGKLGWQLKEGREHETIYFQTGNGGTTALAFVRQEIAGSAPTASFAQIETGLRGVVFNLAVGERSGSVRIERIGDAAKLTTTGLGLSAPAERIVPFRQIPLAELIVTNMMSTATDEEFFRAVRYSQLVDRALKA